MSGDKQRLRITAVLEMDAAMYPPGDEQAQDWLINDILLGDVNGLVLVSNEVGDEVGLLHVEHVVAVGDHP